jgi:hypothetical protein
LFYFILYRLYEKRDTFAVMLIIADILTFDP